MKIAVVAPLWRRPELTTYFINHYSNIKIPNGIIQLYCSVSLVGQSVDLCIDRNIPYVVVPNSPLSLKCQEAVNLARKDNPDYLVTLGSDDFLSESYFHNFMNHCGLDEAIGLSDIYFLNLDYFELGYYKFHNTRIENGITRTVGPGRTFGRKFLDKVDWKLWEKEMDKNLESETDRIILHNKLTIKPFSMSSLGTVLVDVKTKENIWKYDFFTSRFSKIVDKKEEVIRFLKRNKLDFLSSLHYGNK